MAHMFTEDPNQGAKASEVDNHQQFIDFPYRLQPLGNLSHSLCMVSPGHNEVMACPDILEEMKGEAEYKAAVMIWKVCPVILFVVGTLGNLLILKCLRSLRLGPATMHIYLKALAISDLLVLYSGLLRQWVLWLADVDLRTQHDVICRFHTFIVYVSIYVSAWLLVMMTLERTCSACFPYRVNTFCTKRRAWMIILTIVAVQCGLHSHFLFLLTLSSDKRSLPVGAVMQSDGNAAEGETIQGVRTTWSTAGTPALPLYSYSISYKCDASTEEYGYFVHNILPILDICLLSLLPFTCVIFGNATIVWKTCGSLRAAVELNVATNGSAKRRRRRASSMTVMLLLISALFLLTSVPTCVYNIWEQSGAAKRMSVTAKGAAQIELAWACVNIAMYCNYTFNFYLYCLSGRKFRNEIKRQMSRKRTESQSNVVSGFSLQAQPRYKQSPDVRNGHADVIGLGNVRQNFHPSGNVRQNFHPSGKTASVRYKPCSMSTHSNAYL